MTLIKPGFVFVQWCIVYSWLCLFHTVQTNSSGSTDIDYPSLPSTLPSLSSLPHLGPVKHVPIPPELLQEFQSTHTSHTRLHSRRTWKLNWWHDSSFYTSTIMMALTPFFTDILLSSVQYIGFSLVHNVTLELTVALVGSSLVHNMTLELTLCQ